MAAMLKTHNFIPSCFRYGHINTAGGVSYHAHCHCDGTGCTTWTNSYLPDLNLWVLCDDNQPCPNVWWCWWCGKANQGITHQETTLKHKSLQTLLPVFAMLAPSLPVSSMSQETWIQVPYCCVRSVPVWLMTAAQCRTLTSSLNFTICDEPCWCANNVCTVIQLEGMIIRPMPFVCCSTHSLLKADKIICLTSLSFPGSLMIVTLKWPLAGLRSCQTEVVYHMSHSDVLDLWAKNDMLRLTSQLIEVCVWCLVLMTHFVRWCLHEHWTKLLRHKIWMVYRCVFCIFWQLTECDKKR